MATWASRAVGALGLALAVSGCVSHIQYDARSAGGKALDCPKGMSVAWYVAPAQYVVRGCGREVWMHCTPAPKGKRMTCEPTSAVTLASPRGTEAVEQPGLLERQLHAITADILACRPGAEELWLELRIKGAQGKPRRVSLYDAGALTPEEEACVGAVLSSLSIEEKPPASRFLFSFASPREDPVELPKAVATEPPPAHRPAASPAPASSEQALRDALDARAAAILACCGTPRAVIELRWAPDGTTSVELRDGEDRPMEQGCVRRVLSELRAEPSADGGSLLHLVE